MSMRNYAAVNTGILLVEDTPAYDYFFNKVKEEEGIEDISDLYDSFEDVEIIDADNYNVCDIQTLKTNDFKNVYKTSVLLIIGTPSFNGFLNGKKITKEEFISKGKETWGSYLPANFDYESNSGEVRWTYAG